MEDGRFSKVKSDPGFRPLRRKKRKATKVEDKRFESRILELQLVSIVFAVAAETDPDFNDDAIVSLIQKPIVLLFYFSIQQTFSTDFYCPSHRRRGQRRNADEENVGLVRIRGF